MSVLISFICDKLSLKAPVEYPDARPTDYLQLKCKDRLVDPSFNALTVKNSMWKTAGDIDLIIYSYPNYLKSSS